MNQSAINIVFGLLFCAWGVWTIVRAQIVKRRCSVSAQARIVDIRVYKTSRRGGIGRDTQYTPVLEYRDTNGQFVQAKGKTYSHSKREYEIGDTMELWFNPDKPVEHYTGKSNRNGIIVGILLICMGAFLMVFNIMKSGG